MRWALGFIALLILVVLFYRIVLARRGSGIPQSTAQMAGFYAAHGIWCVSEGEDLIPLIGTEGSDGQRKMHRFSAETLEESVARAREWLAANPDSVARAVLVYDGRITLDDGKTDALIIEGKTFAAAAESFVMAVPYRNANDPAGFAVHNPKIIEVIGADQGKLSAQFFEGVSAHEKGAAVWNAHLDESR